MKTDISLNDVTVIIANVSGQTEVADLCNTTISQQDIPRCYVSVDTLNHTGEAHR